MRRQWRDQGTSHLTVATLRSKIQRITTHSAVLAFCPAKDVVFPVIAFREHDPDCMRQDKVLYKIADHAKNFGVIYSQLAQNHGLTHARYKLMLWQYATFEPQEWNLTWTLF